MLLRQKPPNGNFISIDATNSVKKELDRIGFYPLYFYDNKFFYVYTEELKEYLNKGGE